jgi:hypothetical protein
VFCRYCAGSGFKIYAEAVRDVAQGSGRTVVGWFGSWIAKDCCPVAFIGHPEEPRAPEAALDIDLAAAPAHEVVVAVFVKLNRSHAEPRVRALPIG